ncbi:MAG: hypothetical protein Ta2F_02660 [Termitinemataceae bacterium]|nr:MAG: hypothetical protein Ta2F_02660 [Termitinemataceae bacterium]
MKNIFAIIHVIRVWFFLAFVLCAQVLFAQDTQAGNSPTPPSSAAPTAQAQLPRTFRGISLGTGLDELKSKLASDNEFVFRGDPDVSFLPISEQNLVESAGLGFIKRAFFQLKDKAVFIMSFTLNTEKVDHYSVFTSLVEKYGEPLELNPKQAMWENEQTRIFLERPLTIKYIDKNIYDTILGESEASQSKMTQMRQEFLNDF